MHVLFEIYLVPGAKGDQLLTQETLEDTGATFMTRAGLERAGFTDIVDDPRGRERRFVTVLRRDRNRVANWLDTHQEVTGYRTYDYDYG